MKNKLDRDIISLLAVASIMPLEKQVWMRVLPHMTEDEKENLKKNLEQEVDYEMKVAEEATAKFLGALEG